MTDRPSQPRRLAVPFGSPRLVDAFAFALESHATQPRKGSAIPYIAHPLAVASIVLELGGDEDEAIAALLHDVVEDCGVSLEDIGRRFGDRVEELVEGATDFARGEERASLTSAERKERGLQLLAKKTDGHRRLAIADKLHNARSIGIDHRAIGDKVFDRFSLKRDGTIGYYRQIAQELRRAGDESQVSELAELVEAFAVSRETTPSRGARAGRLLAEIMSRPPTEAEWAEVARRKAARADKAPEVVRERSRVIFPITKESAE